MAVKKKFPYRSALVACNGGCHVQEGQSCENGCIGCGICVSVCPFQAIVMKQNVLPAANACVNVRNR